MGQGIKSSSENHTVFITFLFSQCQSWRTGEVREDKNSGISLENATTAGEKVSKSREEAVGKGEEGTVVTGLNTMLLSSQDGGMTTASVSVTPVQPQPLLCRASTQPVPLPIMLAYAQSALLTSPKLPFPTPGQPRASSLRAPTVAHGCFSIQTVAIAEYVRHIRSCLY